MIRKETPEPPEDCMLCPRLVAFRRENEAAHPDWHNGPVESFGPADASLLIMGLAPGLKGANRTGRPFTGDAAGDLLYPTLLKYGFAEGAYDRRPDDGLQLKNAMISNAVRCVPPKNKPVGAEINTCRRFLSGRIRTMPNLRIVLLLGRIAHDSLVRGLGGRLADYPFAHAAVHDLAGLTLIDCYHCSRYNLNTGRLTEAMFHDVFAHIRKQLNTV